ncbi:MAG TPA: patatin-like phospholipase RssA [Proteobacteria bacterium]|nr:patatin-like phospholipase RssA [Pseudomonadota bacterium]
MGKKWKNNGQWPKQPKIGLALGGGSARGWAHIGVINELEQIGIVPDIICGTSIGALVGGVYLAGQLDALREWLLQLDRKEIIKYLDIRLLRGGGFVEGSRLMDFFHQQMGDLKIEDLPRPYTCVSTDLETGREIWFQKGLLLDAIRASIAVPGIFTPVHLGDRWLVDGGLVNPVPVSVCRALGAELVIAVNLNQDSLNRHTGQLTHEYQHDDENEDSVESSLLQRISDELKQRTDALVSQFFEPKIPTPGLFDVLAGSIAIMQDRLTRSRMAGDPPDILLNPHVANIGLLEFDRAAEAIEAGKQCVTSMLPAINCLVSNVCPATNHDETN